MDRKLLIIGGTILTAGGLAYWYLLQQNGNGPSPTKCEDYKSQSECLAHGCYWYFNSCHKMPHGVEPCELLGECYPGVTGWQRCDGFDNLCRCNGISWSCVEEESQICKNDITRGMCAVNQDGLVLCLETSQQGIDECALIPGSIGEGCSCAVGNCHPMAWCEPINKICVKKAINVTLSLDDTNWECKQLDIPGHGGNVCTYVLNEPLAVTKLDGMFYWKWGFFGVSARFYIDIYYNGVWEQIYYNDWGWMMGDTGVETVNVIFETTKAIEKIRFTAESNDGDTNIKPSSFVGWLNF